MAHESFSAFLAMGGHGLYVWLAYGATLLVLLGAVLLPLRNRRRVLAELADRARRDAARAAAPAADRAPVPAPESAPEREPTEPQTP